MRSACGRALGLVALDPLALGLMTLGMASCARAHPAGPQRGLLQDATALVAADLRRAPSVRLDRRVPPAGVTLLGAVSVTHADGHPDELHIGVADPDCRAVVMDVQPSSAVLDTAGCLATGDLALVTDRAQQRGCVLLVARVGRHHDVELERDAPCTALSVGSTIARFEVHGWRIAPDGDGLELSLSGGFHGALDWREVVPEITDLRVVVTSAGVELTLAAGDRVETVTVGP